MSPLVRRSILAALFCALFVSSSLIVPAKAEAGYLATPDLELGVRADIDGNQYHGAESKYDVDNPRLRYSVGTVGPQVKYRVFEVIVLSLRGGMTFFRRFDFYDGEQEVVSYSLENSAFVQVGAELNFRRRRGKKPGRNEPSPSAEE